MEKKKLDLQHQADEPIHCLKFKCYPSNLISNFLLFAFGITLGVIASFHISSYLPIFKQHSNSNPQLFEAIHVDSPMPRKSNSSDSVVPSGHEDIESRNKNSSDTQVTAACKGSAGEATDVAGLKEWAEPPSARHGMTDEELMWRASLAPKIKGYPYNRVPKVAFLYLTRGPLPLAPLWERFFKGHEGKYAIYVHAHPAYNAQIPDKSPFYGRRIPSKPVGWGAYSQSQAVRRLFANALLDFSNQWFLLLSESCIPIYPFTTVYDYLMNSTLSFMNIEDPTPSAQSRYHESLAPHITLEQWRKGSSWYQVERRIALGIVSDQTYFPLYTKLVIIDEHYFQTLVHMKFGAWNANRSLTYVDWSKGGAHPASFGASDITVELLRKMREGTRCNYNGHETSLCSLFARKLRPDSIDPLLNLASQVLGF